MSKILPYVLIVVMTMMGSVAALFLKRASSAKTIIQMIKNKNIYIGGGLYFLSSLLNIQVLRYLDYSTVLPLTSITYIWTMFLAYLILKEKITTRKIIGLSAILCGAWLIVL